MSQTTPRKVFLPVACLVFLALFGLAALLTLMQPKTYAGAARVKVKTQASPADSASFLASEVDAAQSEPVLTPVIEAMKLNKLWGKKIKVDADLKTWESVTLLKQRMEVTAVPETKEIELVVYDDDPIEAAEIANRIAETLCVQSAETKRGNQLEIALRAEVASKPVRPNVPLNLSLGAAGGVIAGLAGGGVASWIARAIARGAKLSEEKSA